MQIRNAVPRRARVMIALERMPGTLHGSSAFVIGYGRIGKLLADRLRAFGADVTVFARKESDRAFAEAFSCRAAPHRSAGRTARRGRRAFQHRARSPCSRPRRSTRSARSGVHRTGFTALLGLERLLPPCAARAHGAAAAAQYIYDEIRPHLFPAADG